MGEEEQTLLVFDANALHGLAVPRDKEGHSWLDILRHTARLSNVKIIIPAIIADLELRGETVFVRDNGDIRTRTFDTSFRRAGTIKAESTVQIDKFLKTASRARLLPSGEVKIITPPGGTDNVIIWETRGDGDRYRDLHARHAQIVRDADDYRYRMSSENPPQNEEERQTQIEEGKRYFNDRVRKEIWGNDEGEHAIDRFLLEMPYKTPAIIVSDDYKYLDKRTQTHTPQGKPIGECSLGTFLYAELVSRGDRLSGLLHEQRFPTTRLIGADIHKYYQEQGKGGHRMLGHSELSRGHHGSNMPMIECVIRHGVAITNGHIKESGTGWLRYTGSTPASIDPASILAQKQNGKTASL